MVNMEDGGQVNTGSSNAAASERKEFSEGQGQKVNIDT